MTSWTLTKFQNVKDQIIEKLRQLESEHQSASKNTRSWHKQKLSICLTYIAEYKDKRDFAMHTLVHIMIALSEHLKAGGLKPSQINDLVKLAKVILTIARIKERTSKLSYLHGELHLVTSQLEMNSGRPLNAAWEQQLAAHLSGNHLPGGEHYHHLMSGIQALNLAQTELAAQKLSMVLENCPDMVLRRQAFLQTLRCYRLSGQLEKASALSFQDFNIELNQIMELEIEWEKACRDIKKGASIMRLQAMVRKKKPHHRPIYLLESFLWSFAAPQRDLVRRLPRTRTLRNRDELNFQSSVAKDLMHCAEEIEKLYDLMIPMQSRLEHAKKLLDLIYQVKSIDRTLLVMGALWRWLVRSNYHQLAELIKGEYVSRSIKLSQGRNKDALGIFS